MQLSISLTTESPRMRRPASRNTLNDLLFLRYRGASQSYIFLQELNGLSLCVSLFHTMREVETFQVGMGVSPPTHTHTGLRRYGLMVRCFGAEQAH